MARDAPVEWFVAGRPLPGETVSGDLGIVASSDNHTVIAVIDGLGHGPEAAYAAECAVAAIAKNAAEPLEPLVMLCHQALALTRGAAMAIALVHHDTDDLDWLAVGNVEAVRLRRTARTGQVEVVETTFHFAGVLGHRLPMLHVPTSRWQPNDTLVMATDGISSRFLDDVTISGSPRHDAEHILRRHARDVDDALVLVARRRHQ